MEIGPIKQVKTYKFWQIVASFVVGVGITSSFLFLPAGLGLGNMTRMVSDEPLVDITDQEEYVFDQFYMDSEAAVYDTYDFSDFDNDYCGVDHCDLMEKLNELLNLFNTYTSSGSSFTSFTNDWTNFTNSWTNFTNSWTTFTTSWTVFTSSWTTFTSNWAEFTQNMENDMEEIMSTLDYILLRLDEIDNKLNNL